MMDLILGVYEKTFNSQFWDMILFVNSCLFAIGTASVNILNVRYTIAICTTILIGVIVFKIGIFSDGLLAVFLISLVYFTLNAFKIYLYFRERNPKIIPPESRDLYDHLFKLFSPHEFKFILRHTLRKKYNNEMIMKGGQDANSIGILIHGQVMYAFNSGEKVEVPQYSLIGEAGFISRRKEITASIEACGEVTLLMLNKPALQILSRKITNFDVKIRSICALEVSKKLVAVSNKIYGIV